jgi:hypothetical protein
MPQMYVSIKIEFSDSPCSNGKTTVERKCDLEVSAGTPLRLDKLAKDLVHDAWDAYHTKLEAGMLEGIFADLVKFTKKEMPSQTDGGGDEQTKIEA